MAEQIAVTNYGNWVPAKLIYIPLLISAPFLGLTLVSPAFVVVAVPCLLIGTYFAYARYAFSPRGRDIQAKLWELVLDRLNWNGEGEALDIGCGNGPLTIALAQRHPDGYVTGIDTWGKAWDYSKAGCERNAEAAGVAGRTSFQKASASALPFEDEVFDAAISNFVFHDVSDTRDQRALVREALRVVKPGGIVAILFWSSQRLLPGYPLLEARLNATRAANFPYTDDTRPELHILRSLGWLQEASLDAPRAHTFVAGIRAPLDDVAGDALAGSFQMLWGKAEPEVTPEDWAQFQRLCQPESPDFILNLPNYYAFITYSLFWGKKAR